MSPVPFDPAQMDEFTAGRKISILVESIGRLPDGSLEIQFCNPEQDLKSIGAALIHHLLVPPSEDYAQNIQAILDAASFLVADVLEDWDQLDPETPE